MTKREEIEIKLDRAISEIDAPARDREHLLHQWNIAEDRLSAVVYCRVCGGEAAVRVNPRDLTVWKAGKLLRDEECPSRKR